MITPHRSQALVVIGRKSEFISQLGEADGNSCNTAYGKLPK